MNQSYYHVKTPSGIKPTKRIPYSTILVLEEASKLGISYQKIPYTGVFKLKYKGKTQLFHYQIPATTSSIGIYCCDNKRVAKNLLREEGLSVSEGFLIRKKDKSDYYLKVYKSLKKPLVVKPVDGCKANNVYVNIKSQKQYLTTINKIIKFYGKKPKTNILVEQMFIGHEYRILTTRKKVLSIIKRISANIIGDGQSTIEQLINKKNNNPSRGTKNDALTPLKKIICDADLISYLKKQALTLESIPKKNKQIFLRANSPLNISLGGDTIDVTDQVHKSVKKIALRAINTIPGLELTGIDFLTKDIYKKQIKENYRIIELNGSPSLDWQEFPAVGPRRHIAFEFLKIMFPELPNPYKN